MFFFIWAIWMLWVSSHFFLPFMSFFSVASSGNFCLSGTARKSSGRQLRKTEKIEHTTGHSRNKIVFLQRLPIMFKRRKEKNQTMLLTGDRNNMYSFDNKILTLSDRLKFFIHSLAVKPWRCTSIHLFHISVRNVHSLLSRKFLSSMKRLA